MLVTLFITIVMFLFFLMAHIAIFRVTKLHHRWRTVSWLALIFFLIYTMIFYGTTFSPPWETIPLDTGLARHTGYGIGALIYIFLFFSYAQFYFLIDRGVSARILVDILNAPNRHLTRDEIMNSYNPLELQNRRLTDMLYGKYIIENEGSYKLTKRGLRNAIVFNWSKKLLHLYPGG